MVQATQPNGRADFYLKIIGILVCVLMALLSWVTVGAISANAVAHNDIKQMIIQMSSSNGERIKTLDKKMDLFMLKAPPNHSHHEDGSMSRKLKQ